MPPKALKTFPVFHPKQHDSHVEAVLRWARQLATGSMDPDDDYLRTNSYMRLYEMLSTATTGLIAVVGVQGIGKTAALKSLFYDLNPQKHDHESDLDALLINWKGERHQVENFLNSDNSSLANHPAHPYESALELATSYRNRLIDELGKFRFEQVKLPKGKGLPTEPKKLDVLWAEKQIGKSRCRELREAAWFAYIYSKRVVLIDLPDYARSDKRLLMRHLSEVYSLWMRVSQLTTPPVIVLAIQKEVLQGHFFFDKMIKIELEPLTSDQMIQSYEGLFGHTDPFTESAILTLAIMSRGIYRRFKRYVALTIESFKPSSGVRITAEMVKKIVTTDRVAEDLDVELEQLFPNNRESRRDAVRIILKLSESGPLEQSKLAQDLELAEYTLSRLLSKMELHGYVIRTPRGPQKIVTLT
jgi:hypothetical protein